MDGSNIPSLREKKISIRNLSRIPIPISYGAITGLIQKIFPKNSWLLGIVFLNDKQIQKLNLKYLKKNRHTDILTFQYSKNSADLAISLETAKRNARLYNTSPKKEIIIYIIHGILHLLGYNDTAENAKKKMFRKQEEILRIIYNGYSQN